MLVRQNSITNKNNFESALLKSFKVLQLSRLQHKNIGVFGKIACGKSTLISSLLTQAKALITREVYKSKFPYSQTATLFVAAFPHTQELPEFKYQWLMYSVYLV